MGWFWGWGGGGGEDGGFGEVRGGEIQETILSNRILILHEPGYLSCCPTHDYLFEDAWINLTLIETTRSLIVNI